MEPPAEPQQQEPEGTTAQDYKIWTIHDPFQYAPPKPDDDPWLLLLKPLLEKDKIRCDSWKDEVENLLIFAGLFSAVVTAFIIESYKKLQQDPNDAMVSLLTHIARRLDSTLNATSDGGNNLIPDFSPSPENVRINALWIISLVLSLTTVLVGTICLQWLREHQSYPSGSPKIKYAIFNMRKEGLERWHVPRILTILPLLLQCALVLFLVGLIDFLQSLGRHLLGVLVPVSLFICLTLLFLGATMVLPTLQGLYLYFAASNAEAPAQCPYKSPQSHAIRSISTQIFHPRLHKFAQKMCRYVVQRVGAAAGSGPLLETDQFNQWISICWTRKRWYDFDTYWLELRDLYMQRVHKRPMRRSHEQTEGFIAIYDSVCGLTSQENQDHAVSMPAVYYAFLEICEWALVPLNSQHMSMEEFGRFHWIAYLHNLLVSGEEEDTSLANFFVFERSSHGFYYQTELDDNLRSILRHQCIFSLLCSGPYRYHSQSNPWIFLHSAEVKVRLLQHIYRNNSEIRSADPNLPWPRCIDFSELSPWHPELKSSRGAMFDDFAWQIGQAALLLFNQLSKEATGGLNVDNPRIQPTLLYSMICIADFTDEALWYSNATVDPAVKMVFRRIPLLLNRVLCSEMSTRATSGVEPSLNFYLAAVYLEQCKGWTRDSDDIFCTLYRTFLTYKKLTIDQGKTNTVVEEGLKKGMSLFVTRPWDDPAPLSQEWWRSIDVLFTLSSDKGESVGFVSEGSSEPAANAGNTIMNDPQSSPERRDQALSNVKVHHDPSFSTEAELVRDNDE